MAAALKARESGVEKIIILERAETLGGILEQCIHTGFGLHYFGEELSGPEYAARFIELVEDTDIVVKTDTMVLSISDDNVVTAVNKEDGLIEIDATAVILAMGCRERPRGALNIAGTRCAGVLSAGTAVDKYGLTDVFMSTSIDSIQSNEQAMGRLRELRQWPDMTPRFHYFFAGNIEKQVMYHERKKKLFEHKAKNQFHCIMSNVI